jgi:hypothetical protein
MKKLKALLTTVGVLSLMLLPTISFVRLAVAEDLDIGGSVTGGTELCEIGDTNCAEGDEGTTIGSIVKTVINILSWVVGVVSVIMIIVAGLKYVTSGGQEKAIGDAKSTILYAIVGLVIVSLAQVIVRFVLSNVGNSD